MLRWAEIYVRSPLLLALFPRWLYQLPGLGRACVDSQRRLKCRFPDVETAVRRLAPRPWLMIHGERDTYIGPEIARSLFDHAREPKELWLVPEAKHNRCRECEPEAYAARLTEFLDQYAPRRPVTAAAESSHACGYVPVFRRAGTAGRFAQARPQRHGARSRADRVFPTSTEPC